MNDIEILEEFIKYFEAEATQRKYRRNISITVGEDDIEAIKNLIQRNKDLEQNLRAEREKKDKIINLMAEIIEECRQNDCLESDEIDLSEIAGTDRIIEYFTNKVEEDIKE